MKKNQASLIFTILILVATTLMKPAETTSYHKISILTDRDSYLPNDEITIELVNTGSGSIEVKRAQIRVVGLDGSLLRVFSMENPTGRLFGVGQTILRVHGTRQTFGTGRSENHTM